jgi:hypothetical protein
MHGVSSCVLQRLSSIIEKKKKTTVTYLLRATLQGTLYVTVSFLRALFLYFRVEKCFSLMERTDGKREGLGTGDRSVLSASARPLYNRWALKKQPPSELIQ